MSYNTLKGNIIHIINKSSYKKEFDKFCDEYSKTDTIKDRYDNISIESIFKWLLQEIDKLEVKYNAQFLEGDIIELDGETITISRDFTIKETKEYIDEGWHLVRTAKEHLDYLHNRRTPDEIRFLKSCNN